MTTLSGAFRRSGYFDGVGTVARFGRPYDVAISPSGNFALVADMTINSIRRVDIKTGRVTTLAGKYRRTGNVDGVGSNAQFSSPSGICLTDHGRIAFVTDRNAGMVRRIDVKSARVTSVAGSGRRGTAKDGVGSLAVFNYPHGLAANTEGSVVFVADVFANVIRRVLVASGEVTTLAGSRTWSHGFADGGTAVARFYGPWGLALSADASALYVTEYLSHRVRRVNVTSGEVSSLAGRYMAIGRCSTSCPDGIGTNAKFYQPRSLAAFDESGQEKLLISDSLNGRVRLLDLSSGEVSTVAGSGTRRGSQDGPTDQATLFTPFGIGATHNGHVILISDPGAYELRMYFPHFLSPRPPSLPPVPSWPPSPPPQPPSLPPAPPASIVQTLAGSTPGGTDGVGTTAKFYQPRGIAVSPSGNFALVTDYYGCTIRHVDIRTEAVMTLAGKYRYRGIVDGFGSDARFSAPSDVVLVDHGRVAYVTDAASGMVRRIDVESGKVTTLAGSGSIRGGVTDGIGTSATFTGLVGIAADSSGSAIFVADNTAHNIRMIVTATQQVTTLVGAGVGSADGTGTLAQFFQPWGLAASANGDRLYVSELLGQTIRHVNVSSRAVTTIAGKYRERGYADGVALEARFDSPRGIAFVDDERALLIVDSRNRRIRKLDLYANLVATVAGSGTRAGNADGGADVATFYNFPFGISATASGTTAIVTDSGSRRLRLFLPRATYPYPPSAPPAPSWPPFAPPLPPPSSPPPPVPPVTPPSHPPPYPPLPPAFPASYMFRPDLTNTSVGYRWMGGKLAMSASGELVYSATGSGVIYGSNDRGVTWRELVHMSVSLQSIDTSESGQHVVATADTNGLYYSHNYGLNWTKSSTPGQRFRDVKFSRDGQKCLVLDISPVLPNQLKLSTDSCETWTSLPAPRGSWLRMGASGDLSTIAIGSRAWAIYVSQDGGLSFTTHILGTQQNTDEWRQIFVSENGMCIIGLQGHSIYRRPGYYTILSRVSTDGGATWGDLRDVLDFRVANSWRPSGTPNSLEDRGAFHAICASRNLQSIYLSESNGAYPIGRIWYTNDFGQNWYLDSGSDNGLTKYLSDGACSVDGSTVAFADISSKQELWLLGPAPMPPSAPPPPPAQPPPLPPQTPYFLRAPKYSRPGHVNGMTINVHGNAVLSKEGQPHGWGNPVYAQMDGRGLAEGYITITPSRGAFAAIHSDGHLISWGGSMYGGTVGVGRVLDHTPWTHGRRARVKYANFIGVSSTCHAFAAVDSRGQIYQWGKGIGLSGPRSRVPWAWTGPNIRGNVPEGEGYSLPASNCEAFATLDREGRIRAWGRENRGGCDGGGPPKLHPVENKVSYTCAPLGEGFSDIVSNRGGFAALASDGSIVAWGTYHITAKLFPHLKVATENYQRNRRRAAAETGFVKIFPSDESFVAV